jgi:DNA-binding CsgD family transcriptional regulator
MSLTDPTHTTPVAACARRSTDYDQALDAIVKVALAADPPDLLDRLMTATIALGATASVYTVVIPEHGSEPTCFSLFACHPLFAQAQDNRRPLLAHPWFRFARGRSTPGTDHEVRPTRTEDAEAIRLASEYGFKSALIIPTPAGVDLSRVEMLCLGSDHPDDFEGAQARVVRRLARALAAELHDWMTNYLREYLRQSARLQASDLDLLTMERRGLGTKEIAQRTGMSLASVDSRFQRINSRLNCPNRKASAKRAAEYGLLDC